MKTIFSILLLLITTVVAQGQPSTTVTSSDVKKLNWLEGSWERANSKPGKYANETWEKVSRSEWKGVGLSMQSDDTTFIEKLRIITKDGSIFYEADVPENPAPVLFRFTQLDNQSFICENPDHDFPKKISYLMKDDHLTVQISGNDRKVEFSFTRIK